MSTTTGADIARDALAFALSSARPQMYVSAPLVDDLIAAGIRPPAPVITGDVPAVTVALDALPAGTVIRIVEEEDGPQVFEAVAAHGHYAPPIVWSSTRSPRPVDSGYIARGETPVTVLWAGAGA